MRTKEKKEKNEKKRGAGSLSQVWMCFRFLEALDWPADQSRLAAGVYVPGLLFCGILGILCRVISKYDMLDLTLFSRVQLQ